MEEVGECRRIGLTRLARGCLRSHLAVVEEARAQGWESILIMEDDVVFAEGFHEEFQQRLCGLPADWDMLFFGCLHYEPPEPAAPGIGRLRVSFSTFMYAVRRTVYDAFIFLNRRERYPVDKNNLFLQRRFRCYCFMPHLAWVDDSYSDAQGVPCTHWYIRDSMALGGDRMKAVERRTAAIIPYLETGNLERSVRNLRYVARCYRPTAAGSSAIMTISSSSMKCNESCEVTLCLSGSGLDHFGRLRKDAPPSDD
jgi:hypothetical protein